MSHFLDEREHAAENLFAHNEELLFLAHRTAVRDLGLWAADTMGLDERAREAFSGKLIDALVAGSRDDTILASVQSDLERAGKPERTSEAATVLAQALARASDELSGRTPPRPATRRAAAAAHQAHVFGASLGWRD